MLQSELVSNDLNIVCPSGTLTDKIDSESVLQALKTNQYNKLISWISSEVTADVVLESADSDGHTALHWACLADESLFVQEALSVAEKKRGSDWVQMWVNQRARHSKQTASMWAAIRGSLRCLGALKRAGADPKLTDSLGAGLAILAVQNGHADILVLIHKWSDHLIALPDIRGCLPSHWAAHKGDLSTLRILHHMDYSSIHARDSEGMTPLHRAAVGGFVDCVKFLVVNCFADLQVRNNEGKSPADLAANSKKFLVSDFLDKIHRMSITSCSTAGCTKQCSDGIELRSVEDTESPSEPGPSFIVQAAVDRLIENEKSRNWIIPGVYFFSAIFLIFAHLAIQTSFSIIFALTCLPAFGSFALLTFQSPDGISKKSKDNSAIWELQENLEISTHGNDKASISQICQSCWEWKALRTKHCSSCDKCVEDFDHHCAWINNCVAKGNHRLFVGMLILNSVAVCASLSSSYCSMKGDDLIWPIFQSIALDPLLFIAFMVAALLMPFSLIMTFSQLRIIALNLNTNEMVNAHKYAHFWQPSVAQEPNDEIVMRFVNPFDKGIIRNCFDFWTGSFSINKSFGNATIRAAEYTHRE